MRAVVATPSVSHRGRQPGVYRPRPAQQPGGARIGAAAGAGGAPTPLAGRQTVRFTILAGTASAALAEAITRLHHDSSLADLLVHA
jgi:hypothetical protein